jgi:hypothetical protein
MPTADKSGKWPLRIGADSPVMLAQQTAQAHAGCEFRGGTAGLQSLSARVSLVAAGLRTACPTAGRSARGPRTRSAAPRSLTFC